ncbi:MAG: sensor histidine kinase [Clostridia bacterium]|nr:sensor histidine kinase [Clostridia bacterium]
MKELSLNILDIAENSVKAGADRIVINLDETEETMRFTIEDNGCGMSSEVLSVVENPFYTTRTTRPVGMGISLLKLAAEQTGGNLELSSRWEKDYPDSHGTVLTALLYKNHIDYEPLGDIISTLTTLIHGSPDIDFVFTHNICGQAVELDTAQLREVLEDVPLNSPDVINWISGFLTEQYDSIIQDK